MSKKIDSSHIKRTIQFDAQKVFGSSADFEMRFYESVLAADPDSIEAMEVLAHVYTRKGLYTQGLGLDIKLSYLLPFNAIAIYNLARSYALLSRKAEALDALERAEVLGWTDWRAALADSDLSGLHEEARFKQMISRMKES